MKKSKFIGIGALCAMIGLSGCNLLSSQTCVHDWSPWEVIEEPTCIDRGVRERYCFKCDRVQSRSIAVDTTNGHVWAADKASDKNSTCTEKGIEGSQYCQLCYQRKKGVEREYSGHVWERVENPTDPKYKDATCTESGLYQNKCRNCDETEDVAIEKLGHLAGTPTYTGDMGVVNCSRAGCGLFMAYQLDITKATGYHTPTMRMSGMSGEATNKAVWDISSYIDSVIPSGSYDIQLEAAMTDASNGNRKMYNMAREDLIVDGDKEGNTTNGTPDKVTESPYRYFVKVDATTYYPTTKESFQDLGLTVGASNTRYIEFLNGVNINKESTTLSLIHGDIGYSLFIKSIRLIPHVHDSGDLITVDPTSGRAGYTLEKCGCGYRKITIDANTDKVVSGSISEADGLVKLNANSDSITYKINVDESVTGSLFMVGRQAIADMDKTPFNITVKNNNEEISGDWADKKSSDFLKVDSNPSVPGYSEEGRILLGEITLKENSLVGTNELVITRTGDYNIGMSKLVIEGRPSGHIHNFEHIEGKDNAATCRANRQEYWKCSCGQYEYRTIPNTMLAHNLYEYDRIEASCDYEGTIIYKCSNPGCNYNETVKIPKAHEFVTTNAPEDANYSLTVCSKCEKAYEATWMLDNVTVEDYKDGAYVATTATPKSGKMSDNSTNFSVLKFDTAKRRVVLNYKYNGGASANAKLSLFATTKASNIANCQPYQQTIGQESAPAKKLNVNVNGDDMVYSAANKAKNIGDLGLKNVKSNVSDNGELADPMWLEYVDIELINGNNVITIEAPTKTEYSMYIGGFRISY